MPRVKGVVLCGGRGEALKPLTNYFQKSMVPVGSLEKPVLEYIVRHMAYHGLKDIVLLVGYKAHQIANYFNDGSRFGVRITYVLDEEGYSGTGGALIGALKSNAFKGAEVLLVHYGDILTNLDLRGLLEFHFERKADATLAVAEGYRVPVGVAEVSGGVVVRMVEKPVIRGPVTIGVLALSTSALKLFEHLRGDIDLMRDLIPKLLERGGRVLAYRFRGSWIDVGASEAYEKLNAEDVDALYKHLDLKPVIGQPATSGVRLPQH